MSEEKSQESQTNQENQNQSSKMDEMMAEAFEQESSLDESSNEEKVSFLLDVPLEVTVEIGSTLMPIEDVLKLNPNSVVELDRFINEPVDLKVNGKVIAKGELYTVHNNFGIKIIEIITPEDRMKIVKV